MPLFYRIWVFILAVLLTVAKAQGQDPNFSQFFVSPLTLNPALTGKFDGNVRIAGNYRNQWPSISKAFITQTASLDFRAAQNLISETDIWGIGIMAMTDKTANGLLNNNYLSLSTSYHKELDENGYHQVGVGFQGTYANKRLDGSKLHFAEEIDQLGGWTAPTTEPLNDRQVSISYFDFAMGILYNGTTDGTNNFYIGVSAYHLLQPKETFAGNGFYHLNQRYTAHAGARLPVGYSSDLHISVLHSSQLKASNTVLGGAFSFLLDESGQSEKLLYLGSWWRYKDAIIPYIGIELNGLRIGTSYDINSSGLRTASQSKGGIEMSLIYIVSKRTANSKGIRCPIF